MRLVGGRGKNEGNVFLGNFPVCDDQWGNSDGEVVCRQLGYAGLVKVTVKSFFGNVSSEFAMDDVNCTGSEAKITDCPHSSKDNCGATEGAGVICQTTGIIWKGNKYKLVLIFGEVFIRSSNHNGRDSICH